jgi:hypothetical protein
MFRTYKALKVALGAILCVVAFSVPLRAQFAPPGTVPIQQVPSRADASTGVCATAPAINATQATGTCTITPPGGQFVYFNFISVGACQDGTASVSSIQQNFTTTNLGGLTYETSTISYAATTATSAPVNACAWTGGALTAPLKSAQAGTAVTIVPPAQAAHVSFPIVAQYYFGF